MKKILLLLLLFTDIAQAQIVIIPDANFKSKLTALGYDTNSDGNFQYIEIQVITNLDVSSSNIQDLTGIQSFQHMGTLDCSKNQLTSLNLTGLINFENTGFAPAVNVAVKDFIDINKFDVSTLQVLYASHTFNTRINYDKVEFIFENINLPTNGKKQ